MCLDKNANITHKYFQIMKIYTKNRQKSKKGNEKMSAYGFKNSFKTSLPKVLTLFALVAFSHFCLGAKVLDSISQNPTPQDNTPQDNTLQDNTATDSTPTDSTLIESADSQDFADSII